MDIGALLFPYHLGPKLGKASSALLYHGRISAAYPAWPGGEPINAFIDVLNYTHRCGHRLHNFLEKLYYQFDSLQVQAIEVGEKLDILGDRFSKIMLIHPGTPDVYEDISSLNLPRELLLRLEDSLLDNEHLNMATTEFFFRIYELMLIYDYKIDKVLYYLDNKVQQLGSPNKLLVECLVNRYTTSMSGAIKRNYSIFTDSQDAVDVLSFIGKRQQEDDIDLSSIIIGSISFKIFDKILNKHICELTPEYFAKIEGIFSGYWDSLKKMKLKCISEAAEIYYSCKNDDHIQHKLKETISRLSEEASEIYQLDTKAVKSTFKALTEDHILWSTLIGTIASLIFQTSPIKSASVGITAISKVGTTVLSKKREYEKKLGESPWAVLYHLN